MNAMPHTLDLRIARLRLEARVERPLVLPEFAGSALRGAFGHALRKLACVTGAATCPPCPLYRNCPYPALFEPPPPAEHPAQRFSAIPAPYVVEPPRGPLALPVGANLRFHLVLFGLGIDQLPLLIAAWQRALARRLGPRDGAARLDRVVDEAASGDRMIWSADSGKLAVIDPTLPECGPIPASASLDLLTPLRLQHQGRPLGPKQITAERLLIGLIKRIGLLDECHDGHRQRIDFKALAAAARQVHASSELGDAHILRRSQRQGQLMRLDGVRGRIVLSGDLAPFWPFLHLGQWTHLGKNASFGLGQYRLIPA